LLTVDWSSNSITTTTTQAVYVRRRWSDDWSYQPQLWAQERVWSLLPSMPTATLTLDYGRVLPHGGLEYETQPKLDIGGWYVLIVDTCSDGGLSWIGFIDEIGDEQGGMIGTGPSAIPTGRQTFVAYSIVQLLAQEIVTRTRWADAEEDRWAGCAGTFNENGKGNKVSSTITGEPLFCSGHLSEDYGSFWSSKDIVEYIFNQLLPVDKDGEKKVKFEFRGLLPDWDKPTIETEGKSVLSLLLELVNPSRMYQMSALLQAGIGGESDTIGIKIHSLSAVDLDLPNGEYHFANFDKVNLQTVNAHDTNVSTQGSVSGRVDQVIVKGDRRETCGTFQITTDGDDGEILQEMFTSSVVTAYQDAASATTGYSGLTSTEKKRRNAIARNRKSVEDCYRVFTINSESNMAAGGEYVFQTEATERYYPWWAEVRFNQHLPFKRGIDYSGTAISGDTHNDAEKPEDYRPPLVMFKRPSSSPANYLQCDRMAAVDGDPSFAASVGLEYNQLAFTLEVQGAEQHAIAHGRFTALADDKTTAEYGSWDYRDSKCTLSIREDRFAEGRYPQDDALPTGLDMVRRKIIYAGPSYKLVRVLDETVVDANDDGTLSETTAPGILRDDLDKLSSLAELAASWWCTTRKVLRLSSARPSATIFVGQMVESINPSTAHADTINTVISEVRLSTPLGEGGAAPPATFSLTTAMGELDALAFAPPPPTVAPRFQAIAPIQNGATQ
jgi:hypothetical protein